MDHRPIQLSNEYASVQVELDEQAAGPRLRITDTSSGVFVCLDPFELQALAWVRHEDLAGIVSPAHREAVLDSLGERAGDGRPGR